MLDWEAICQNLLLETPQGLLKTVVQMPALPQAVMRFTTLAEDPNAHPRDLAKVIEVDATLTAELLRHVNSAMVGMRRTVCSAQQAITILGPRRCKTLVLTASLQNAMRQVHSPWINLPQFRQDCLERALFAKETARVLDVDPETAYTAALLADFALPLLSAEKLATYQQFASTEQTLADFERETLGADHSTVAANLISEWGFPPELIACMLLHHQPDQVLADARLCQSPISAVLAAAALPDSLRQNPAGLSTLLQLQDAIPKFRFLEVAAAVDEQWHEHGSTVGHRQPLCDRLGQLAMEVLEQRRTAAIQVEKHVGNYMLEQKLGEGSAGVVYRARHPLLKRPAAVKLLNSARISPRSIDCFEKEVQLTSQLSSPNTIQIYDYGVTPEGVFYYVMELIDGMTLQQLVRRFGPQPEGRTIHLLVQACRALTEAHSLGLIHRDVKPDNLMLCNRGGQHDVIKVVDFGLAKAIQDDAGGLSQDIAGTPLFMSPESIQSPDTIDGRSDLYSLGGVGYFLLTGHPVFPGDHVVSILKQQVSAQPQPPSTVLGRQISPDLETVILSCLEKSPDRRPTTPHELAQRLLQCQDASTWTEEAAASWWCKHGRQSDLPKATPADEPDGFATMIYAKEETADADRDNECFLDELLLVANGTEACAVG